MLFQTYRYRVIINIFCRAVCIAHVFSLAAYIYYYMHSTYKVLFPLVSLLGIICEGYIVICRHGGKQSKWFSYCIFFYLTGVIPYFWIMETKSALTFNSNILTENGPDKVYPKLLQQSFYIIIILLRIFLPKYNTAREQTANVVKFLLNVVSDAQELQSNVLELRTDRTSTLIKL